MHGHALDPQRVEELLALVEGLRVRVDDLHVLDGRCLGGHQAVGDAHDRLGDDRETVPDQQIVALVDGAGVRVLEGHDPELHRPDLHGLEDPAERMHRHGGRIAEQRAHRTLAVGAGLALEGDPYCIHCIHCINCRGVGFHATSEEQSGKG